jgi:hypothetical protein
MFQVQFKFNSSMQLSNLLRYCGRNTPVSNIVYLLVGSISHFMSVLRSFEYRGRLQSKGGGGGILLPQLETTMAVMNQR